MKSSRMMKYLLMVFSSRLPLSFILLVFVFGCASEIDDCERLKNALLICAVCDLAVVPYFGRESKCISDEELEEKGHFSSISVCADFVESIMLGCDEYEPSELEEHINESRKLPEGCECHVPIDDRRYACGGAILKY